MREVATARTECGRLVLPHLQKNNSYLQNPEYGVAIQWTTCHSGGKRPWFVCPAQNCGRRVAILYGGSVFACRHCYRLAYPSQLICGPEAAELVRIARQVLETAKEVIFQMADVTQIDSGGVGALGPLFMAAHNREAKIKLAALHPRVAEVLRVTNLEMLFDIRKSEGEAVEAFLREQQPAEMGLQSSE
jgi:anti-anti-sigma factor